MQNKINLQENCSENFRLNQNEALGPLEKMMNGILKVPISAAKWAPENSAFCASKKKWNWYLKYELMMKRVRNLITFFDTLIQCMEFIADACAVNTGFYVPILIKRVFAYRGKILFFNSCLSTPIKFHFSYAITCVSCH